MRVRVRAALPPAGPDAGSLLGDADQDDAEAALPLGLLEVRPGDLLLRLAPPEADDRDLVAGSEALDRAHVTRTDLAQKRRRRDREAAIEQEADQEPLAHQLRHIRLQKETIDRAHLKRHPVAQ
jgi:hypothetical protein